MGVTKKWGIAMGGGRGTMLGRRKREPGVDPSLLYRSPEVLRVFAVADPVL